MEEQAQIYATLDPSGSNIQFSILEDCRDYRDMPLSFLINSRSSHSFVLLSVVKNLQVGTTLIGRHKLRDFLDNGSTILAEEQTVELPFQLEGNPTSHRFKILKMGKFQGIFEMDWLS